MNETLTRFAAIAMLGLTAVGLQIAGARMPGSLVEPLDSVPRVIGPWSAKYDRQLAPAIVDSLKADSYLQRFYKQGRDELELFIAYYAEQRAGESIHTPKHCLPGAGWEFTEMGTSAIPFGSSQVVVNNYLVQQGQERLRILYWYHSRTRVVANEYAAKFYLARDALLRGSTDGAIVKIVVRDQPGAARKAEEFAASLLPAVQRCFNQQR